MNNSILILRVFGETLVVLGCLAGVAGIMLWIINMREKPDQRDEKIDKLLSEIFVNFNFLGWLVVFIADVVAKKDEGEILFDAFISTLFLALIIIRIITKAKIRRAEAILNMLDRIIEEEENQGAEWTKVTESYPKEPEGKVDTRDTQSILKQAKKLLIKKYKVAIPQQNDIAEMYYLGNHTWWDESAGKTTKEVRYWKPLSKLEITKELKRLNESSNKGKTV